MNPTTEIVLVGTRMLGVGMMLIGVLGLSTLWLIREPRWKGKHRARR